MIISAGRLLLRPFEDKDAQALYLIHREENVARYLPNESYADAGEALSAIRFFAACAEKGRLPFVLAVTLNGQLIGDVGINEVEGAPDEVEIGFCISQDFSSQGYATQAALALEHFATPVFNLKKLQGRVMQGNAASCRVLEKCGYRYLFTNPHAPDDPWGKGMLVYEKTL